VFFDSVNTKSGSKTLLKKLAKNGYKSIPFRTKRLFFIRRRSLAAQASLAAAQV
jgi:hypothetical protein